MTATAAAGLQELQETVSRISSHKGVEAVLILNKTGDLLIQEGWKKKKSDDNNNDDDDTATSLERAALLKKMMDTANKLAQTLQDSDDDVSFIRIRTKHYEIMLAPQNEYLLVVLHDPLESSI